MSLKLWKLLSVRIKVEDNNGKIHWYDETDCEAHNLGIEYDIEDDVNRCVEYAINLFYKQVSPKRSYRKSFIRLNQS